MVSNCIIVVPARGGSKRVPRKNIHPLGGVPLIFHTLAAIQSSSSGCLVFVSTDDNEIATKVKSYGVGRIILRPPELSHDTATTESVLLHVVASCRDEGIEPSWVMTLPPTSPFRSGDIIKRLLQMITYSPSDVDCIMTMTENRGDFWISNADGTLKRLFEQAPRRQQDRIPMLEENSAAYLTRVSALEETGSILGRKVIGLPINAIQAYDINTLQDFLVAEAIFAAGLAK